MISILLALLVTSSATSITFPGAQPQLAAVGSDLYVTFGSGDRLSVARSSDGGASFAAPVTLPQTTARLSSKRVTRIIHISSFHSLLQA